LPGIHTGSLPSTVTATRSATGGRSQTAIGRTASTASGGGGGKPLSGYSPGVNSGQGGGGHSPLTQSSGGHNGIELTSAFLKAEVRRLAGCMSSLPKRFRLVLELSTGIGAKHALGPAALARRLHVTVRRVRRLQRRALLMLVRTARTHSCAGSTTAGDLIALEGSLTASEGGPPGALGGVEAARYAKPAAKGGAAPAGTQAPGGASSLGITRTPGAGNALLAIAVILTGMLLIALLFAEELGLGPHIRRLRSRWLRRPPH
jgi:hypothetical protein